MTRKGAIKAKGTNKKYEKLKTPKTWSNGKLIKGTKAIDSINYSLHYASPAIWEGIRAYKQVDGTSKIFRLQEHAQRLLDSAKIIGFEIPYSLNDLMEACKAVVEANGGGDLYLRPIVYAAHDAESAKPQDVKINVDIYAFPIEPLHSEKKGIKCVISAHKRGYPQYQMQAKTASNYAHLQLVKPEIKAAQVDDVFILDNEGYIVEATVANIWVFKDNVAMTPPNNGSILPGITRRCVAGILQDPHKMVTKYKMPTVVMEKRLTRADLYTADCIIICGTYAEIVNVIELDGRTIGSSETQTYFKILKAEYSKLVRNHELHD
jgi:branched-chain amino acid aminotransferase